MAYAADKLVVEGLPITQLDKLEIQCEPGTHGWCRLSGYVESENGEALIYGMQEYSPLQSFADDSLIFGGLFTNVKVSGMGNTCYVGSGRKNQKYSDGPEKTLPFFSGYRTDIQRTGSCRFVRIFRSGNVIFNYGCSARYGNHSDRNIRN